MSTLAIVGAGPGLGMSVARRFGREGYSVALLARDVTRVGSLADRLQDEGIHARGYFTDVRQPGTVETALKSATNELGDISVLQYSPLPARAYLQPVLDLSAELALEALQFSALSLISCVSAVLPAMREARDGSIILVNGGTSVKARPEFAGTSIAFPAESAYGEMLHDALEGEGIRIAQLVIPGAIPRLALENGIADVADRIWDLSRGAGPFRTMLIPLDQGRE